MSVKILVTRQGPQPLIAGEIYELSEAVESRLVELGKAQYVDGSGKPVETTALPGSNPRATAGPSRKKAAAKPKRRAKDEAAE